jgi:FkbH-like protein
MQQSTDMPSYLRSLEMKASLSPFNELDASRIAQLINKSNQFNLTTRRRSEAEVLALIGRKEWPALSVRLLDRFGDHGLIAVVITEVRKRDLWIDTWLMSCRVLKRQVEELTLNEIFKVARHFECERVVGVLIPTDKNQLVQDLYEKMGFEVMLKAQGETRYQRDVKNFREFKTEIDQGEVTK